MPLEDDDKVEHDTQQTRYTAESGVRSVFFKVDIVLSRKKKEPHPKERKDLYLCVSTGKTVDPVVV